MAVGTRPPWWKGPRGEWFVVGQFVLGAFVVFGPRTIGGVGGWTLPFARARLFGGATLLAIGGLLALASARRLGRGLTAVPYPKADAPLVQDGPFALVRHPIYSSLLIGSLGVALMVRGWLTFVYVAALFVLLDVKSRLEERWLVEKFPAYRAYQRRVRRLLPFVY